MQSELGIIPLRNQDMLDVNFSNPSLIWGPTDSVAVLFSWLTPSFMKTIPFGEFAGQEKFWPFFWMLPAVFVYFILISLALCFILNFKETKQYFVCIFKWIKRLFAKKKEDEEKPQEE